VSIQNVDIEHSHDYVDYYKSDLESEIEILTGLSKDC
jgi:hypothetical protein